MKRVRVHLGPSSYTICISAGLLSSLGSALDRMFPGRPVAVISDTTVAELYSGAIMEQVHTGRRGSAMLTFPAGEPFKNSETVNTLYTAMLEKKFGRDCIVLAAGGGITGDMAGFVAATYMRGVPFVQFPTTLLAQADSSVGGKTGINHALGKNLIGSFYQPSLVIIDTEVLATLPRNEMISGMGEVLKYGLIRSRPLFHHAAEQFEPVVSGADPRALPGIIRKCCAVKAAIVRRDEKEAGLRRILNFGHTMGHALETCTGYSLFTHGEAVVTGMRWALFISLDNGLLSQPVFDHIDAVLGNIPVPCVPADLTAPALVSAMALDKKARSGRLSLVLLKRPGRTHVFPVEHIQDLTEPTERWLRHVST